MRTGEPLDLGEPQAYTDLQAAACLQGVRVCCSLLEQIHAILAQMLKPSLVLCVRGVRTHRLPILFFQFGMESSPTREPLLNQGVISGHIPWVDFAIEVPGMYFYHRDEGTSGHGKLAIPKAQFYPSKRSHKGGTFKWRAPVGVRLEGLRDTWRPSPKPYQSLVGYVHNLASGETTCSLSALTHVIAEVVQTVTVYHATYHETANLISNNIPNTFASALAAVREVGRAQLHLRSLMEKEECGEGPCFFMRYEVRIRNLELLVRDAYLSDVWELDETSTMSCAATFMRELTTLIYWYHFEIFAVGITEVSTRREGDVSYPAFVPMAEAQLMLSLALEHLPISLAAPLHVLGARKEQLLMLICSMRAMSFCCSEVELNLMEALEHMWAIEHGVCPVEQSHGSKLGEKKWCERNAKRKKKEGASEAVQGEAGGTSEEEEEECEDEPGVRGTSDDGAQATHRTEPDGAGAAPRTEPEAEAEPPEPPEPPPPEPPLPPPETEEELWFRVAQSFKLKDAMKVYLVAMGVKGAARAAKNRKTLDDFFAKKFAGRRDYTALEIAERVLQHVSESDTALAQKLRKAMGMEP